jgi:2-polyprenyl-3-methyl-5-hydroxy-6-metoxy-1,4-benzoquinol methylase
MSDNSYRERIYRNYATRFQDAPERFDEEAALRWGLPYNHYLRGWLPVQREAAILELACGGGKFLHFLKQRGFTQVHGVDISPEQVALSRQVLGADQVTEGDAIAFLESHPGEFDLIVAMDLIEHFRKDECLCFLDACASALRPGGRLILQTPNAESPWGGHHRYNDFTHELGFNPNSILRLLSLAGLEKGQVREMGPVAHGLKSLIRWFLWRVLRRGLWAWNMVEIGNGSSGVYTRVMLASAVKH